MSSAESTDACIEYTGIFHFRTLATYISIPSMRDLKSVFLIGLLDMVSHRFDGFSDVDSNPFAPLTNTSCCRSLHNHRVVRPLNIFNCMVSKQGRGQDIIQPADAQATGLSVG